MLVQYVGGLSRSTPYIPLDGTNDRFMFLARVNQVLSAFRYHRFGSSMIGHARLGGMFDIPPSPAACRLH